MAFIEVNGFSFSYPVGQDRFGKVAASSSILENVSFRVEEGSFCIVTGPTGSGKTTLLRSLKPELCPVGIMQGTILVAGKTLIENGNAVKGTNAKGMDITESALTIGYVMQDPEAQIVCDTVWHELAFGLENLGISQNEMRRRIAEIAHFFGIEPWIRSATENLSGGQKQIVNLAAALALRPRLLLLDEPTSQLDPNALRQFLFMLNRVHKELGTTVVMTTHSPEDISSYATQHIKINEIKQVGQKSAIEKKLRPRWDRWSLYTKRKSCLSARETFFRYEKHTPWILRNIDLDIAQGSVHVIVGGNGCGKSTLLKLMAGVLVPQRGRVINTMQTSQAMLPQDPKALFVCDSVAEELDEWRTRCGYTLGDEKALCERFGLIEHQYQHPYDLSCGQRQKLAIVKLLLCNPSLLLLDEPTKGLDSTSCADISHIVRSIAGEGRSVVIATHDLDFALVTADVVSMIFDGEIVCSESAQQFFANNLVYQPNKASRLFGCMI